MSDIDVTAEDRRAVHDILEHRAARAVFQPIVSCETGKVLAFESLARPDHPVIKNPMVLFAAAAAEGLVGRLGRMMRELAVAGCPDAPLFLNIHPVELGERYVVSADDPMFQHEHDVYIEITESVPLSHVGDCHTVLAEVRARGAKLVVDDLGAGYSNLKYIADLAPEIVKLDRALITSVHRSKRLMRLVRGIVHLCLDQGAEVVAEGIETAEELSVTRELGVHFAQGYLLARPAAPPPSVSIDMLGV